MVKKLKNRKDIDKKYKWDISSMYPNERQWEKDVEKALKNAESFTGFAGRLTKDSSTLLDAFKKRDSIWQTMEKAYVYARMKRDEDNEDRKYQSMCGKAGAYMAKISAFCSFFVPELLKAPKDKLMAFIEEEPGLSVYRFAVTDILRQKKHILSKSEENIMAQIGEVMPATNEIFTMLNNADLEFGNIKDENGRKVQLTHGNYINFMESRDRNVRRAAYKKMYNCYREMINTIGAAYNYNTKTDVVNSRIRKYSSSRAAALSGDNIPDAVYDNLVGAVNDSLPVLHKYMSLRKKALKTTKL